MIKAVTAAMAAGMFVFLALIVPEHLVELEFHDNCANCRFIQHAPLLEPETVTDIAPLFQTEWLLPVSGDAASPDIQLKSPLSRAPPSHPTRHLSWQTPKATNSALRSVGKMLIYLM
jgi:hypothetical protein